MNVYVRFKQRPETSPSLRPLLQSHCYKRWHHHLMNSKTILTVVILFCCFEKTKREEKRRERYLKELGKPIERKKTKNLKTENRTIVIKLHIQFLILSSN